jgi:hypothetical protein
MIRLLNIDYFADTEPGYVTTNQKAPQQRGPFKIKEINVYLKVVCVE